MTENVQNYHVTYKDVTDYENILIRLYHSYLSTNYLAELISITLRHLPEDADVEVLCDLAEEYEAVAPLAADAAAAWSSVYFDMVEFDSPPAKGLVEGLSYYDSAKKEMESNIGRVWLNISEIFDAAKHAQVVQELDDNLLGESEELQEQYGLVLTNNYPTMPEGIRQVITALKQRAIDTTETV